MCSFQQWEITRRVETDFEPICYLHSMIEIKYDGILHAYPIEFYLISIVCDIYLGCLSLPLGRPFLSFDPGGWLFMQLQQQEQEQRRFCNINSVTLHAVHFSHASKYHHICPTEKWIFISWNWNSPLVDGDTVQFNYVGEIFWDFIFFAAPPNMIRTICHYLFHSITADESKAIFIVE